MSGRRGKRPQRPIHLIRFDQIRPDGSPAYLVRGLIPRQGIVVAYGAPKCGKTFWALDLCMHVVQGRAYRGRQTHKGAVVYVACEGVSGIAHRIEATRRIYPQMDGLPFYLVGTRLDLVDEQEALINSIRAQLGGVPLALIVIDTLNRSFVGSENSDEDMGNFIKAADEICEEFNCAVMIIHHSGHYKGRPRGHSSLLGAADAVIAVTLCDGVIVAEVEDMKDGAAGARVAGALREVELGSDGNGEIMTSCIVVPVAADQVEPAALGLKPNSQISGALEVLRGAIAEVGRDVPPGLVSDGTLPRAITFVEFRQFFIKAGLSRGAAGSQSKAFNRAAGGLRKRRQIAEAGGWIWIRADA